MNRFADNRERKTAIREGKPIEECGIILHPITVRYYDDFNECKPVLLLRLATLPAKYACKDWFSAIYTMEIDAMEEHNASCGLMYRFAKLLSLAMRLPAEHADGFIRFNHTEDIRELLGISIYKPERTFETVTANAKGEVFVSKQPLKHFGARDAFCRIDGGEECFFFEEETGKVEGFKTAENNKHIVEYLAYPEKPSATLTTKELSRIRETLAMQNGETLPDEADNPELIQAQNELAAIMNTPLEEDFDDLLASVAYASGKRTQKLLDWPIVEFTQRVKAIGRYARYVVCGINEGSGATWKNGNPQPSWCYDRKEGWSSRFTPIGEALGKMGHTEEWLNTQIQNKQKG